MNSELIFVTEPGEEPEEGEVGESFRCSSPGMWLSYSTWNMSVGRAPLGSSKANTSRKVAVWLLELIPKGVCNFVPEGMSSSRIIHKASGNFAVNAISWLTMAQF